MKFDPTRGGGGGLEVDGTEFVAWSDPRAYERIHHAISLTHATHVRKEGDDQGFEEACPVAEFLAYVKKLQAGFP